MPKPRPEEAPDPVDIYVGRQIRRRRLEMGLTQTSLGRVLGVSFPASPREIRTRRQSRCAPPSAGAGEAPESARYFHFLEGALPGVDTGGDRSREPGLLDDPRTLQLVRYYHKIGRYRTAAAGFPADQVRRFGRLEPAQGCSRIRTAHLRGSWTARARCLDGEIASPRDRSKPTRLGSAGQERHRRLLSRAINFSVVQPSALTGLRIFRHFTGLPPDARGAAVAIGNFDGVHLGHQAVIEAAVQKAHALDVPAAVLTFEPHPRMLFKPGIPRPFRLTPLRPKAHAIEALGVDVMVVLAFDRSLSQKSAEDFADDVLMIGMAATHVVVGADFVFGHDRLGTVDRLIEMGARARFAVTALAPVAGSDGDHLFIDGSPPSPQDRRAAPATTCWGDLWEIEGRVEHGDARGRQLGFPTANMGLGDYLRPAFGVYAVRGGN